MNTLELTRQIWQANPEMTVAQAATIARGMICASLNG